MIEDIYRWLELVDAIDRALDDEDLHLAQQLTYEARQLDARALDGVGR